MAINICSITGVVMRRPWAQGASDAKHEVTFAICCDEAGSDGKVYALYVPIVCYGKVADLACTLDADAMVGIEGRLCWPSRSNEQIFYGKREGPLAPKEHKMRYHTKKQCVA